MTLRTKKGYDLMDVASCLQKAIRRGKTDLAGYMAIEMYASGFAKYCWKRLLVVSAEDCAGIITQEIKALHDTWVMLTDDGKKHAGRVFISKAVVVLCASRKCRDADHLTNFIYDRDLVDAKELLAAVVEARQSPEKIEMPDWTFDVHTSRGRKAGKTKADFIPQEFEALSPRQPGLFDWVVELKTEPKK